MSDNMESIWQCALNVNKEEFRRLVHSHDERDILKYRAIASQLNTGLTYMSLNKPGLSVEESLSIILSHQNKKKALTGSGYDMVCFDYPGTLTSEYHKGSKHEYRQVQDYIYRQFVQLGLEEKCHMLLPAQSNREGLKVNKNKHDENQLVDSEHMGEALGIAQSATNIITVNRDGKSQAENRITYFLSKSRSSEVGWAIVCKSDFGKSMTHSDDMGGTCYRGNESMSGQIGTLLETWNGKEIPSEYTRR
jgi:hypothetical protein